MEPRPAPPVTIEGGRGWQLDSPTPEQLGDDTPSRPLPRPARTVVTALVACAVGAGAATGWHDWRTETLAETEAGVLSLEAIGVDDVPYFELVTADDGRLATAIAVALRNTGPRDVALREVSLPGAGFVAEDVDDVRVRAGSSVRVTLVRAVDCTDEDRIPPPGPLHVRATTSAGEAERDLRVTFGSFELAGESVDAACGRQPPMRSLQLFEERTTFDGSTASLEIVVRNASALPVRLSDVRPLAGLSLVLTELDGSPLRLPLELPPGDFSQPRRPLDDELPVRRFVATVAVVDCERLPDPRQPYHGGYGGALLDVDADVDAADGAGSTVVVGDAFSTLPRLRAAASCADVA